MGDLRNCRNVEYLDAGIPQRLGEHEPCVVGDGGLELGRVARIDERAGDPEPRECDVEHLVGAAVDVSTCDDVSALTHERDHAEKKCSLAAGGAHGTDAAFERGQALFEHGNRRVGQTRVEMAWHLEVEQTCGMVTVVEHVRRREVQRHSPGPGGGVRLLTGMEAQRVESQILGFDHDGDPTCPPPWQ